MSDPALLSQVLLAAVLAAGSIGNQSLLERLRGHFPQLSEDQFWTARDALIEAGELAKDRGRGGAVKRTQAEEGGQLRLPETEVLLEEAV